MPVMNQYEYLDMSPEWAKPLADLIEWSTNYNFPMTPYVTFLDLIGFSQEHYGERLIKGYLGKHLGYLEMDMLADALKVYANRPLDVEQFILKLDEIAMEED